eukprot:SAG11_NODE_30041_length_304_cov_6.531707_1_plen_22_part_10
MCVMHAWPVRYRVSVGDVVNFR